VERKGTKYRCGTPPDAGLLWYPQQTELVDDGFADELVEFLKNRG